MPEQLVNPLAHQYAERYTSGEDALLREVAEFTIRNHPKSQMISGHLQGKLLEFCSRMVQPDNILEIGTFTGYSALCLAAGLKKGGRLHTIELRKDDAETAKGYFERSPYREQIVLHIGDAMEIIGGMEETWDLVFIDADKENYINYFNLVFPKVRPNGLILADNVLFHGEVLKEEVRSRNAKAIQSFNDFVLKRNDVDRLMLPVRDGIFLLRKLHD